MATKVTFTVSTATVTTRFGDFAVGEHTVVLDGVAHLPQSDDVICDWSTAGTFVSLEGITNVAVNNVESSEFGDLR